MKKIKFEDLPSQNSPINATNLNQMQDNIENELDNINTGLITISSIDLPETAVKTPVTLVETTIEKSGIYLFKAIIPMNFYGQSGRELFCKLLVNDAEKGRCGGVINTYVWSMYSPIIALVDVPANSNVKIVIQDTSGKSFACSPFTLQYIKLK